MAAPGQPGGGYAVGRVVRADLRPWRLLAGGAEPRHSGREGGGRGGLPPGRHAGPPGGGDQRRALPAPRGRGSARRVASHRHGQGPGRSQALSIRGGRELPQVRSRDALPVPGARGRPDQHGVRGRPVRIRLRETLLPPAVSQGPRVCLGRRAAGGAGHPGRRTALRIAPARPRARAAGLRAFGHHHDGIRRLFPDCPRLHPRGARARHSRGTGPRLRRRLPGGLRARHHQCGSAQVRPAVRAVPESRAHLHAGHRRGLLLRASRRGDRVRAGALRAGQRRPDHYLWHAQSPRGGARCGPGAALHTGGRRPDCQADSVRAGLRPGDRRSGRQGAGAVQHAALRCQGGPAAGPEPPDRGPVPPRVGPRRRRGDRPGAVGRLRAGLYAATKGRRQRRGQRGSHHYAVRHDRPRAGRHAQDGLPGPQDVDRDSRRHRDDPRAARRDRGPGRPGSG